MTTDGIGSYGAGYRSMSPVLTLDILADRNRQKCPLSPAVSEPSPTFSETVAGAESRGAYRRIPLPGLSPAALAASPTFSEVVAGAESRGSYKRLSLPGLSSATAKTVSSEQIEEKRQSAPPLAKDSRSTPVFYSSGGARCMLQAKAWPSVRELFGKLISKVRIK